jgi:hypothetical protein
MSSSNVEIPVRESVVDLRHPTIQKLLFIANALEKGWSVKKKDAAYIFSKKHEGKREIFRDDYLDTFVSSNFDMQILTKL